MSVPMTFVILFSTNGNLKSDNRSDGPTFFIFHISFVALLLQYVFYNAFEASTSLEVIIWRV